MQCKLGDTVRFLNDVGGGVVVKLSGNQVVVRDSDGFDIPVLVTEVVVVETAGDAKASITVAPIKDVPALKPKIEGAHLSRNEATNTSLRKEEEQRSASYKNSKDYNILLGFCPKQPDKPTEGGIELYLINDSSYHLLYTVGLLDANGYINHLQGGELEPDSKLFLQAFDLNEANIIQQLSVGLMLYKEGRYELREPEQLGLTLNPVKLFRPNVFIENDYFEEKALLYKLLSNKQTLADFLAPTADEIAKAMKEKKGKISSTTVKKQEIEVEEVDLHIDVLVDSVVGLSNAEILNIQLSRFTTALDLGMRSGTKRMVFIHGVGNGKLKHEIHRLLDTQYAGKVRYQDASFKEYGYGATMVLL